MVKLQYLQDAVSAFSDRKINVTSKGRPYLGAPLDSDPYITNFAKSKVENWVSIISTLTDIANSQPHAAYSLSNQWLYLCRTTPNMSHLLDALEVTIRQKLLPSLTGHFSPSETELTLFSLPTMLGRLYLISPITLSHEYNASQSILGLSLV